MDFLFAQTHNVIGVIGTLVYLGSYLLLQMGAIRSDSYTYCFANMAAASLVMTSLLHDFNLASALIQISWVVISALGIFRLVYVRKRNQCTVQSYI